MNKKNILFVILFILCLSIGFCSFGIDGFEDGDFTNEPTWTTNLHGGFVEVGEDYKKNGDYGIRLYKPADQEPNWMRLEIDRLQEASVYKIWMLSHNNGVTYGRTLPTFYLLNSDGGIISYIFF